MRTRFFLPLLFLVSGFAPFANAADLYDRDNLIAWCIVPFDAKKRGPEERAAMLASLGLKRFAYDYRKEHIPTWDAELEALKKHGVELTAWWFPRSLNDEAKQTLALFQRHKVKPQLWINGGGEPTKDAAEQAARVETEAKRVQPIAEAAAPLGCQLALYNHGGWWGEPENQIAVIERLKRDGITNVGIVYNLHHGHEHLDRFPELLAKMKPYLLALNLNGMTRGADKAGKKIMILGQGEEDARLLRQIRDSGWRGLIGILNHTGEDAETRLKANLEGLEKLVAGLSASHPERSGGSVATGAQSKDPAIPPATPPASSRDSSAPLHSAQNDNDVYVIPAAKPDELTRANGWPKPEDFRRWDRSLGGPTSNRFSALTQIDKTNVAKLEIAWTYNSGDGKANVQCNPIIVDGVMFAPTAGWNIVALDAATGKERWRFTPEKQGKRLEDQPARRGLLYWPGDAENPPRVIFGAGNWLYALDPQTGKTLASFGENGRTNIPAGTSTVAAIHRHMLVAAGYAGDVFGFDIRTGALRWTFKTKPARGEYGHETWSEIEQGANCWGGMALDESRGIAYIGTGSPKPNFFGMGHLGDNLFSNCVLALDAQTGKRLWHFQEVRHDIWDWDIPAPPNLITVERHGVKVDAVAQVTKLGNTLLLDRVTGQPLYDFKLTRVATKALPGDIPAPYQPAPELPQPFARQAYTKADLPVAPEAQAAALPVFQRANLGPYPSIEEGKPTLMFNIHGGAEWTGAAADSRGRLYVTSNEIPWHITPFRDDDPAPAQPPTAGEQVYMTICFACHGPDRKGIGHAPPLRGIRHRLNDDDIRKMLKEGRGSMPPMPQITEEQMKPLIEFLLCRDRPIPPVDPRAPVKWTFGGWNRLVDAEGYPGTKPPWGTLNCIDLNTGKLAWQVPLGEYPELAARGVPKTGQENFAGCMVTASSLVFASGTRDKKIRAFDADTGTELWSYQLPLHGTAPPASYEIDGRQFIVLPVTGGGKLGGPAGDAWMAFALPK